MLSSLRSPEGEEIMDDFASRGFGGMRLLPARLARLTRDFAIIFVRESFFAAAASVPAARASAIAAIVIFAATATAVTATTAAAAARTTRTAAAGFRFRACFIYFQIATADVFAVESRDGFRCFSVIRHFHETEAARPTGLAIGGHVHARELAEGLEERAQILRGRLKAHVADKEILHGDSPLSKAQPSLRPKTSANPKLKLLSCTKGKWTARCRDATHAPGGAQGLQISKSGRLILA